VAFRVLPGSSGLIPGFSGQIPGYSGFIPGISGFVPGSFRVGFVGTAMVWAFFPVSEGNFLFTAESGVSDLHFSHRFCTGSHHFRTVFALFHTFFTPFPHFSAPFSHFSALS
jgi:hypothetical protein